MIEQVLQQLDGSRDARLARLKDLLRIESVSTDPQYKAGIEQAAKWVAGHLEASGFAVSIEPTASHPVVLGQLDEAGPDAPHVLFYGHYDVQPPDPLAGWRSPPFEPTERDGAIHARGASDDKGQVCCFLEAVRAWREAAGTLPIRLTVMIEGDEECGSTPVERFVADHRDALAADVALVSDTAFWNDHPAITYALRGLLYFEVVLHGPGRDLHSGVYGGTVANPLNELTKILGRLFDDNHHIAIPGFYDHVARPSGAERDRLNAMPFDDADWAASAGVRELHGEGGYSTLERRAIRPSCDINGLAGGYQGAGAKTVIPTSGTAKVSFRLAADQVPDRCAALFRNWLESQTPPGCRWEIKEFGRALPVRVATDSPHMAAAVRAMTRGCGAEPLLVPEGATIPVIATFKQALGLDTILMGFGKADDAIHSPNEKFDLEQFEKGCRSHALLFDELAKNGR